MTEPTPPPVLAADRHQDILPGTPAPATTPNPVTPDELKRVLQLVGQAELTRRNVGYLRPEELLPILLAAVPGGPIPPDHPASFTLVQLLFGGCKFDSADEVNDLRQSVLDALSRWPGNWGPVVVRLTVAVFQSKYDDSRRKNVAMPLIEGLLLDRQPCVQGGRTKTMKTTLACDVAAALVTGTHFLGRSVVPSPVLYLTRERPSAVVRRLIETSAERRQPNRRMWQPLSVTTQDLLATSGGQNVVKNLIRQCGARVVFIDPLNLMIGDVSPADLIAMGRKLRSLCDPILDGGGTPVLLHHTTKDTAVGEYPVLDDLSGAGVAEFARSWLLLSRVADFSGGHEHQLLALAGTSNGDYQRLRLTVNEATMEVAATADEPTTPTTKQPAAKTWPGRRPV